MTTTSFVVTGFGPFGGVEENPTTVIVRRIDTFLRFCSKHKDENDTVNTTAAAAANGSLVGVADLVKEYVVLETSAADVDDAVDRIRRDHIEASTSAETRNYDGGERTAPLPTQKHRILLLHLGVGRSKGFRLESCAYNDASFRIPDQRGYQPTEEPIVSDPDHKLGQCYETSLDLKDLRKQMERDFPGIMTGISTDPGRFVCNYLYCKSLEISRPYSSRAQQHRQQRREEQGQPGDGVGSEPSSAQMTTSPADGGWRGERGGSTKNENLLCESLFLHVPHFSFVPEEEQVAYVAGLIKNLAGRGT